MRKHIKTLKVISKNGSFWINYRCDSEFVFKNLILKISKIPSTSRGHQYPGRSSLGSPSLPLPAAPSPAAPDWEVHP